MGVFSAIHQIDNCDDVSRWFYFFSPFIHFEFSERFVCGCDAIQDNIGHQFVNICRLVVHQSTTIHWRGKFSLDKKMEPFRSMRCQTIATVWQWFAIIWLIKLVWLASHLPIKMPGSFRAEEINYFHFTAPTPRVDLVATHSNQCVHHFSILFAQNCVSFFFAFLFNII